jgi:hypothetical protein
MITATGAWAYALIAKQANLSTVPVGAAKLSAQARHRMGAAASVKEQDST